ncbi:hypothetical protein [Alkalibacillus silvisoli]|uniref:Transcriptional regulator n=1 Tax=Alkalibacillus silvisoli TaxID=392823 RepID=A0ABN1A7R9_9BACI
MRKIVIGIVGPSDSVERSLEVIKENEGLDVRPFTYKNTEDVNDLIKMHNHEVDQWLFTGPAPYEFAMQDELIDEDRGVYAKLHGSSLLNILLKAFVDYGRVVQHVSLDTIGDEQLKVEQFNETNFHRVSQREEYRPTEELVELHRQKYESGETEVAITCIHSVYQKLKELGVPVYRVVPSDLSIQLAFDYLKQRAYMLSYRKKQFVIVGFEVCYPSTIEEGFVPYQTQHRELDLHRVILKVSEKMNGSFVKVGNGKYFIYTTRGDVDLFIQEQTMEEIVEQMLAQSELNVRVGIGYGHTVLEADEHLHIAFDYARKRGHYHIILVNEEKEVIELKEEGRRVAMSQRFLSDDWIEKYSHLSINPTQLSKIYALKKHYEKDEITSSELAHWLQSSERNARRILLDLEGVGLAKVIGEESGRRGRPKKVYQLQNPK